MTERKVNWVFEPLPHYRQPPLPQLPPIDDYDDFKKLGVKITPTSRRLLTWALGLSGFRSFYHKLSPQDLEELLLTLNTRLPGLFSPVISASVLFNDSSFPKVTPVERAVALVLAALEFFQDLKSGTLPQDTIKDILLDMSEYPNLFGTTLCVEEKGVRIHKTEQVSHILLIVNGRYYILPLSKNFQELEFLMQDCVEDSLERGSEEANSPGWLTAADDRFQLRAWRKILRNPVNRESLEQIKHTLLTVCLDLSVRPSRDQEAARYIHIGNPGNRFYFSGTQIVVLGNSKAGAIFNFTNYIDGNPMSRFADELFQRSESLLRARQREADPGKASPEESRVQSLRFFIPPHILNRAQRSVQSVVDVQPHTFLLNEWGRNKLGPFARDAAPLFVVALLAAVRDLTGRIPSVLQFISMTHVRFVGLNLELITTEECKKLLKMLDENASPEKIRRHLVECIRSQREIIRKSRKGLTLSDFVNVYLKKQRGIKRLGILLIYFVTIQILRMLNYLHLTKTDIMISHPTIKNSYKVISRPGVRLPYVQMFALHYQIHDEFTRVTFMPGKYWRYPNETVVRYLQKRLEQLLNVVNQ